MLLSGPAWCSCHRKFVHVFVLDFKLNYMLEIKEPGSLYDPRRLGATPRERPNCRAEGKCPEAWIKSPEKLTRYSGKITTPRSTTTKKRNAEGSRIHMSRTAGKVLKGRGLDQ